MRDKLFLYRAINIRGEEVAGEIAGSSEDDVMGMLDEQNMMILEIRKENWWYSFFNRQHFWYLKKIGFSELARFAKDLGIILKSGISILEALDILKQRSSNALLKKNLETVQMALRKGESLSEALTNLSGTFPDMFIFMVKTGETSGELPKMLEVIGQYYEERYDNQQKIKEILFYPIVLIIVSMLVTFFLLTVVLPQFAEIFLSMDQELPQLTLWFMSISDWLRDNSLHLFLFLISAAVLWQMAKNTPAVRLWMDQLKNILPVYGKIGQWEFLMLFAKTFGILMRSGSELIGSLNGLKNITNNLFYKQSITILEEEVKKGASMSSVMESLSVFEEAFVQFMAVGESSGMVSEMMEMTASFYESQYKHRIGMLKMMLEPFLLLIIGGGVLFMILAIMMPVFDLYLIYSNL
ncbi:type II secretion system F family protein [Eubacteriaceae bacterium ES3]|nr:type II secretion system F family protein [Eubacteriaceae bacterium ES3]